MILSGNRFPLSGIMLSVELQSRRFHQRDVVWIAFLINASNSAGDNGIAVGASMIGWMMPSRSVSRVDIGMTTFGAVRTC
jgi:hypothetical protein